MLCKRISLLSRAAAHNHSNIKISRNCSSESSQTETEQKNEEDVVHEFQPLVLYPKYSVFARKRRAPINYNHGIAPRSASMTPDQDWGDVWPTARSFHPGTVPLPVRMGWPAPSSSTPDKWGNAELMKIPNFLHLTPPVVQRQCAAIRKFCTPWPEGVSYPSNITVDAYKEVTEESKLKKKKKSKSKAYFTERKSTAADKDLPQPGDPGYFPVIKTKSSYLYSGPSIRDIRARVVTIKFQMEDLNLTEEARDKLMRLLDDRFDPETNTVNLTVDRCPLYCQNLDYAHYLMTVLRTEAEKKEPWEHERTRTDHSKFIYAGSSSQLALEKLQNKIESYKKEGGEVESIKPESVTRYQNALDNLLNECEDDSSVYEYSDSVLKMLGIKTAVHDKFTTLNPTLSTDFDASLPDIDIKHLYTWHYQEKKKVIWIDHSWTKEKVWW